MLHVKTDCVCTIGYRTLTGRTLVHTKAATELLIRRRLNTKKTWSWLDMVLVLSNNNMADRLMKVPQRWFTSMKMENGPKPLIGTIQVDELNANQIMAIHRSSGHPGVQRTTYFVRRIYLATPRAAVKMAIRTRGECQSINPAPVLWEKGTLEIDSL